MPLDVAIGLLVGFSATLGAIVLRVCQGIWRTLMGIRVTYEPI